ncbi:MAG: endonuclease III domain-containing protein [Phycisphaerae bacterium]|nr:endonuclease III domain-containing protein [Phycisphaerae bacterium]
MNTTDTLKQFYLAMMDRYGPQGWWPAGSPFEMIVGAMLTQNTAWVNVEKALLRLKAADALTARAIDAMPIERLAELIRPAGYFNVKARRLKNLVRWMVDAYDGDVERMKAAQPASMRRQLLDVNGVGPETADSMMLYALGHPRFVVDAYTYRIAVRHGLICPPTEYDDLQAVFEDHLPSDAAMFNEYHALLVRVGKEHCKPHARCEGCPLEKFPHDAEAR